MTKNFVEVGETYKSGQGNGPTVGKATSHLIERLSALQRYFDLDPEELNKMEPNKRADCIRRRRLITETLSTYHKTRKGQDT